MYVLKIKKFQLCACMHRDSVAENIEGDVNLHPLTPGLVLI